MKSDDELKKLYKLLLKWGVIIVLLVFLFIYIDRVFEAVGFVLSALSPAIIGVVIAYLLNYPMQGLEKRLRRLGRLSQGRAARVISLCVVYVITLGLVSLLAVVIVPELAHTVEALMPILPEYLNNAIDQVNAMLQGLGFEGTSFVATATTWQAWLSDLVKELASSSEQVIGVVSTVASSVANVLMGLLLSVYLLFDLERILRYCNRALKALLPRKIKTQTMDVLKKANQVFESYIATKIITSFGMGVVQFVIMSIFGWPQPLLSSAIVAVGNLVPMIGPIVGGILSGVLVFAMNPAVLFWYVIVLVVLFIIEGNVISPKLMADKIGMPVLIVLLGVIVCGGFLGVIGMILGPPLLAIAYYCVNQLILARTKNGGATEKDD